MIRSQQEVLGPGRRVLLWDQDLESEEPCAAAASSVKPRRSRGIIAAFLTLFHLGSGACALVSAGPADRDLYQQSGGTGAGLGGPGGGV